MECINATSLHRKSGQMGHPALVYDRWSLTGPLYLLVRSFLRQGLFLLLIE
jgi:hypothetical protein